MQRYFIVECTELIEFDKSTNIYYHLTRVLRSKLQDQIELCDENQICFVYYIIHIDKNKLIVQKSDNKLNSNENSEKIILAISLLKHSNFELVLQKAVELGVDEIVPFTSSRTIIKSDKYSDEKYVRFNKIITEAAEQSKRFRIPILYKSIKFDELFNINYDIGCVAYEKSDYSNHLITSELDNRTLIIIGPEGGFSNDEINFLEENNIKVVSLGKQIMRAETAAMSAVAILKARIDTGGK